MKKLLVLAALFFAATAFAGTNRVLDGVTITNGGSTGVVLTLPTTADTLAGIASTQTLTNKSMSGSSNTFTNIPASSALTGQVGVANGGTGASTLTANGIPYGNGTSAVGVTAAGSQYQCLQAGSGGTPQFGAVQLNQSAAVSGALAIANGGTGATSASAALTALGAASSGANSNITSLTGLTTALSVGQGGTGATTLTSGSLLVGAGTSAVTTIAPGTSGNVLTSNGSVWQSTAPSPVSPSINSSSAASPVSVTAVGGVSLSNISYSNFIWVTGAGSNIVVTATPSITAGTAVGQQLTVIATGPTSSQNITLNDEATTSGSKLHLNGNWTGIQYSALVLVWDGAYWNEVARR